MAGSGDEITAGAGGHSYLRTSHVDRDQVIDVLKAAFVQGRLAKDEFDLRVGQVLASRTYADLAVLTGDIPAGLTGAQPPEPARESSDKKALSLGKRIDIMGGLPVVAVDYPMALRLGIVAAGFILGGLIIAIGRYAHRHRG